jgi:hypothetical protein
MFFELLHSEKRLGENGGDDTECLLSVISAVNNIDDTVGAGSSGGRGKM